ncbi:hypothetical protein PLEOSDRAFT_1097231 [Pleurotus ostreatus PC15]|uniref:Uncharacterized protein n=1 Tax=Pleurotus ostreatus (strain PC15) TaxID=1137138 RepID=A0A067NR12_PLEO1|nr:hypothetical protein PLEOSDRAFT_1097231 [Pleurotus ostreatus PC15]
MFYAETQLGKGVTVSKMLWTTLFFVPTVSNKEIQHKKGKLLPNKESLEQNNAQIEDDICLDAGLDLAQRKSLNIFDVGAVRYRKESQTCKCETHFDVDCERCFDWVKICMAEMTGNPLPGKVKRLKWPVDESEMHL